MHTHMCTWTDTLTQQFTQKCAYPVVAVQCIAALQYGKLLIPASQLPVATMQQGDSVLLSSPQRAPSCGITVS